MMRASYLAVVPALVSLLGASAFSSVESAPAVGAGYQQALGVTALQLDVVPIEQSGATSCGEAVITMAYDYAYPDTSIDERSVIEFAEAEGLFTPDLAPFTSPADMVTIAQHFAGPVQAGNVKSQRVALALLSQELQAGQPIIIDVTTRLDDLDSGAHFVLVTGLSVNPQSGDLTVTFNNPLSGMQQAAAWAGNDGLWNSWQQNGDPGGSGWWLVVPSGATQFTP